MLVNELTSCVLITAISSIGFWSVTSADCTLTGSPFTSYENQGLLQSSGYPSRYYGNERCQWSINPPNGARPGVMILNLTVETNVDGLPDTEHVCYWAENYVQLGRTARGCGREDQVCVAVMLMSTSDLKCHKMVGKHFSHCMTMSTSNWPLNVSFVTSQPDNKKGFSLNYTFYDCDEDQFPSPASPDKVDSEEASGSSTLDAAISSTTTSTTSTTTTTTKSPKIVRTIATKPKTTSKSLSPTTLKSIEKKDKSTIKSPNLVLIIVLVLLCVLLAFVVVGVIFRKRLPSCVREKPAEHKNKPLNNNVIQYADAYTIPVDKGSLGKQPLPLDQPPLYHL